jgi:hypothetical protein
MSTGSPTIIAWGMGGLCLGLIIWQGFGLGDLEEEVSDLSARMDKMESKAKRTKARSRSQPLERRALAPAREPSSRFVPSERLDDEDPEAARRDEAQREVVEGAVEEVLDRREQDKMDQWLQAQLTRTEVKVQEAVDEGLIPARVQADVVELLQTHSLAMWNLKMGVRDGEQSGREARDQYTRHRAETHAALADLIGEEAAKKLGPGPPRTDPRGK